MAVTLGNKIIILCPEVAISDQDFRSAVVEHSAPEFPEIWDYAEKDGMCIWVVDRAEPECMGR